MQAMNLKVNLIEQVKTSYLTTIAGWVEEVGDKRRGWKKDYLPCLLYFPGLSHLPITINIMDYCLIEVALQQLVRDGLPKDTVESFDSRSSPSLDIARANRQH
jgi:hypothetical protein